MSTNKKSLVTIKVLDVFGNPISKTQYHVKNQKTSQLIAEGNTNSNGCIVEISRDKGTILDVYLKSMFTGKMQIVKSFVMDKDRMLVTITSPKILLDLSTILNQGDNGKYKRKTHTVVKNETLTSIANQHKTTVRALEQLNELKNVNKISVGQVLKLPLNIPANGDNVHQDKPKSAPKAKTPDAQKKTETKNTNPPAKPETKKEQPKQAEKTSDTISDYSNKAREWVNDLYEEKKKSFNDAVGSVTKIFTSQDRSNEGGTPKAQAPNLCLTKPQCISSGKSELIREINIRLAGFGGALPTDEFTELTAKCIKQFQRDYMGVPETGKICGSLLAALDKFYYEYPVAGFMKNASCPCGKCSGYGNNRRGVTSGLNKANEYPGLHRSLIWILKAVDFYLKNEFESKKIEIAYIASGYRCIENNGGKNEEKQVRTSVNHMGLALDIHFNKNGKRTRELNDMEFIRKNILMLKMAANEQRIDNKIYIEPKKFNNGSTGATTWVHFDITKFSPEFFTDSFFKKKVEELNGGLLTIIVKSLGIGTIMSCAGMILKSQPKTSTNYVGELVLTEQDIIDIMKVTETEVIKFKNETTFVEQASGVVDTILNRTKSGVWGDSVRSVVNAHRQFSKITGPKNLDPYGSVQKMPMSDVSVRIRNFVNKYLIERANGKPSIVGGHLNYANKYYSDEYNRKAWVDAFHDKAIRDGMIFGNGKAIHAHGTVSELQEKIPKPFKVKLPDNFKGI